MGNAVTGSRGLDLRKTSSPHVERGVGFWGRYMAEGS